MLQSMPSPNNSPSQSPNHSSSNESDDEMNSSNTDRSSNEAKSRKRLKAKKKSKKKKKKKTKSTKRSKTTSTPLKAPIADAANKDSVSVDDAMLSIQILSEQIAQIKQLAQQRNVSLDHPDIKTYLERLNRLKMFARQKIDANEDTKSSSSSSKTV